MAMIVNATTIDAAIGGAEICLHELQSAATTLQSEAPNVGIGQEDVHLQQFLGIVNQCVTALEAPHAKKYWNTTNTSGNRKTDGIGVDFLKRKGSIDYGRY